MTNGVGGGDGDQDGDGESLIVESLSDLSDRLVCHLVKGSGSSGRSCAGQYVIYAVIVVFCKRSVPGYYEMWFRPSADRGRAGNVRSVKKS